MENSSLPIMENSSLPKEFKELMLKYFQADVVDKYFESFNSDGASTAIRLNPLKMRVAAFDGKFNVAGDVPWCSCGAGKEGAGAGESMLPQGFYLAERPKFMNEPFFLGGLYYVQDASSMFLNLVYRTIQGVEDSFLNLKPLHESVILDLCAAPGGKSTHLASLFPQSLVVVNEVIKSRVTILAENVAKWGYTNLLVSNSDPRDFQKLPALFDLVLIDAPCSGEGMFRKEPQAVSGWSSDLVKLCAERQRRIISDIWPSVAPGGFIVYSTCTFNGSENDENSEYIASLGAEIIPVKSEELQSAGILTTPGGGYQFIPGLVNGEGQYFAILRKNVDSLEAPEGRRGGKQKSKALPQPKIPMLAAAFGADSVIEQNGDYIKLYRKAHYDKIKYVAQSLKTIHSGVIVARLKGKDLIPYPDFALSDSLLHLLETTQDLSLSPLSGWFSLYDVSEELAVKYFNRETFILPDAKLGFLLLRYCGLPIGFVKNIGNRVNILR